EICFGMMNELKQVASSLEYMRPQRIRPQREYVFNNSPVENIDESGANSYVMLYSLVDDEKFTTSDIAKWFNEFGYKLEWESVGTNRGQFVLVDKNGIRTNLVDNGFGVGQSLPVLVNLFVSESDRIIIDSPEAFLQTKMQASIADYIIKSSKQNKMIMIETSSEYLLLRIRRRLTEKWIQPCDLSIYFINQADGNGAKCENIQVDASGRLMTENNDFNNFFSTDFEDMSVINWGGI
ncbi:MAG: hypothetical protein J6N21_04080, partial [Butyrivibrio sp.]|nr:hypothetical protein [Butyrivibrio sp.]